MGDTNLSLLEKIVAGFPSVSVRNVMGDYVCCALIKPRLFSRTTAVSILCPYKRQMLYIYMKVQMVARQKIAEQILLSVSL